MEQENRSIDVAGFVNEIIKLKEEGFRLVGICCTKSEVFELSYSFDKDYAFLNLKLTLPLDNAKINSISGIYQNAFLYENEMQDLFGIEITGMNIDYKGKFYRTRIRWPYRGDA